MEDISWGKTEHYDYGLTVETLAPAIEDLAEFHAYQLVFRDRTVLRFQEEGLLKSKNLENFKKWNKRDLTVLKTQLLNFEREEKVERITNWFIENYDSYFEMITSKDSEIYTICHGDFHQGNVMIEIEARN